MQYTIRNVEKEVDRELRRRAKRTGKSVNTLANEALRAFVGLNGTKPTKKRDLSQFVGAFHFDKGFDEAVADLERVNPEDWK